jgi:hypothetical protein
MTHPNRSTALPIGLWLAGALCFACDGSIGAPSATGTIASSNRPGVGVGSAADGGTGDASANVPCTAVSMGPRRLWRLTATQYDNTLQDLFGMPTSYGAGFPADAVGVGFSNAADALLMTPLLADKLQTAADDMASKADLTRFASCAGSAGDDTCLRQFISSLGERAFRRPLASADVDRYFALAKQSADFDSGARLVVTAMLQSPHFLYRFELGTQNAGAANYQLSDYEIASELSYLLWQSMPDDTLFAAAKAGQLHEPTQVAQQVDRLLKSPRARPVVRGFVFDWLGLSTIATVPKDPATFPELTDAIRSAMIAEAERFIDHVMFEQDGSVAALLTSPANYLDAQLVQFYGVQSPAAVSGDTSQAVMIPEQDRRGVLTLGGVLLTHPRSNDSSPVQRGKLVRERLLCQALGAPPPGVLLEPPPVDPSKTTRERYAEHASNAYCATCHSLMDPIGLAFEHFDGVGRFRSDDQGNAIDVTGAVNTNPAFAPTDADGAFVGTDQLIDKLDVSADVRSCYALSWFRFAYGEGGDAHSRPSCMGQRFQQASGSADGSLASIVSMLTQADWFYTRRAAPDTGSAQSAADAGVPNAVNDASVGAKPPMAASDAGKIVSDASVDAGASLPAGLQMQLTVDNDWGQGYCRTYQLHNTGSAAITWSIALDIRGTMNNHWECEVTADSGNVSFSGEDYNGNLAPGATAEFGYCAAVP